MSLLIMFSFLLNSGNHSFIRNLDVGLRKSTSNLVICQLNIRKKELYQ